MSQIYGLLGIQDYEADRTFVNQVGQHIVYEAVQREINRINEELNGAIRVFVSETTEDFKRRYKLPGAGYMQLRSRIAPIGATKQTGGWDVAFPLLDYGDSIATDDVSVAYMSVRDLNVHLDSIQARSINTTRHAILQSLLNNTVWPFKDELNGDLNVQPLANQDGTVYPPVIGSDAEAEDNHYLVSGYTTATISDANDPFPVIVDELAEHFGQSAEGDNIVVFFGTGMTGKVEDLSDFEVVNDRYIQMGANANEVVGLPANLPGVVKGRHAKGAWGVEWRRMPADYMLAIHMDVEAPLIERVDTAASGLERGLQMVARNEAFPLEQSFYRMRRGFGAGNRLNGVVMQMKAPGAFDIPAAFAR